MFGWIVCQFFGDLDKPFCRGLYCTQVDISADEATAQFHGNGLSGAAAHETVEDDVSWVGGCPNYATYQRFRLLCRVS